MTLFFVVYPFFHTFLSVKCTLSIVLRAKSRPVCIITAFLFGQFVVCAVLSVGCTSKPSKQDVHYPSGCSDNWGHHIDQLGNVVASHFWSVWLAIQLKTSKRRSVTEEALMQETCWHACPCTFTKKNNGVICECSFAKQTNNNKTLLFKIESADALSEIHACPCEKRSVFILWYNTILLLMMLIWTKQLKIITFFYSSLYFPIILTEITRIAIILIYYYF